MKITKTLYVTDRAQWRAWLEQHHEIETEIWLIYYKVHSQKPRIPYDDAVEEALCFGWIDSTVKTIDDEQYAQKFTPRKDKNNWSDLNKRRMIKLLKENRITTAGLAKIDLNILSTVTETKPARASVVLPEYIEQFLRADPLAWDNFSRLSPSCRREYIGWIDSAKRAETRAKRLKEALALILQNRKLGMK